MLSAHHAAKAGEEAFGKVRVCAVHAVGDLVVDPFGFEFAGQTIPMAGFIGKQDGTGRDARLSVLDAFAFVTGNKGQGAARTLANGDHRALAA